MIRDYVPLTPLWLRGLDSLLEAGPEVCVCVHACMKNVCLSILDFIFSCLYCIKTPYTFDNSVNEIISSSSLSEMHVREKQVEQIHQSVCGLSPQGVVAVSSAVAQELDLFLQSHFEKALLCEFV